MSINILGSINPSRFYVVSSFIALWFFAYLFGACSVGSSKTRPLQIVVRVNGQPITSADLITELLRAGVWQLSLKTDQLKMGRAILDRLLEEKLLLQAAKQANISIKDSEVAHALHQNTNFYPHAALRKALHEKYLTPDNYREQLKNAMVIKKYLQQELEKLPPFEKARIKIRLEKEKAILFPKRIRARQILVQSEEEARFVISKVKEEKIAFETAAKRYSLAPEAENGGDLGWFQEKQLPKIFDYCFELKKMRVSEAVVSEYGYHIFQVIDEEVARLETPLELKTRVLENIANEHEQSGIKQVNNRLRKKGRIEVDEKAFIQIMGSILKKK